MRVRLQTLTANQRPALPLFSELKRRNVFKVGIAYVVVAWIIIQLTDVLAPQIDLRALLSQG
jgi:preprotein translocase subunit SecY